jgi:hypothetical protein
VSTAIRLVIVPAAQGRADVYQDDAGGLIHLDSYASAEEAARHHPGARPIPTTWDAPIIDPADPTTYPPDLAELRPDVWP